VDPIALLNGARSYLRAADLVFRAKASDAVSLQTICLEDPIYFLYFHAVELLLKAFVRSHGKPVRMNHRLSSHFEECRTLGLPLGSRDMTRIGEVVKLLEAGNIDQGHRYFTLRSRRLPDLAWTQELIQQLMDVVLKDVTTRCGSPDAPGPAVKFDLVFGKPVPKPPKSKTKDA
jgi:hypothetical protein